jgi:NAD(P)-dependent dehydrogenase (short-subunit alcohol dehydrogenase family)
MSNAQRSDRPVTIITGAGSGIGRAAAIRMHKHGPVVIVGRRTLPLQETGAHLGEEGTDWISVEADITSSEGRQRIIDSTLRTFGRIDTLVNNAAIGTCGPLSALSEQQIIELIDINLTAPILLTRLALPHLIEQNGCIVSIGSRAAIDPIPGLGTYGCTKAGLEGMARALSTEYGEQGIRAFTIHPGAVETDMLRAIVSTDDLPNDQVLKPDDLAEAIEAFILGKRDETSGAMAVVSKS